jgi:hypothetical protein
MSQQWEYYIHQLYPGELEGDDLVGTLNDQGQERWEAVAILSGPGAGRVLFKRPLVSDS